MSDDGQVTQLTQAQLLSVVRRITPLDYTAPLETNANSGWEIHEAHALQLSRASLAVQRLERDALILQAGGARYSRGEVTFSRTTYAAGAVTLVAGTLVEATESRRWYRTELDAMFGNEDLAVTVPASAVRPGYGYDCPAGAIDNIVRASWASSEATDTTIMVENGDAFDGGAPAALDALAWERRITRGYGEADESLLERVRTLPDTVSPNAIRRLLERFSQRFGVAFESAETAGDGSMDLWLDDTFYLDDTTEGVLDSAITERGAFFLKVPDVGQIYDSHNYLDDDLYLDDDGYLDDWDAAKAQVAASVLAACDAVKLGGVTIVALQIGAPEQAPFMRTNWGVNYG